MADDAVITHEFDGTTFCVERDGEKLSWSYTCVLSGTSENDELTTTFDGIWDTYHSLRRISELVRVAAFEYTQQMLDREEDTTE